MDSRVTMALAGVLFLGALLAGYWGLNMSRSSSQPQPEQANFSETQVDPAKASVRIVAARAIPAYSTLRQEDLTTEAVAQNEVGEFTDLSLLHGKTVWTSIPAGVVLSEGMLEPGGALASMIKPNERAVAIGVDEVIAAGGHVVPGDFVDVLVFLRGTSEAEGQQDSAQVVVPAARLLAYGPLLGPNAGSYRAPAKDDEEAAEPNPGQARSAVVAIPQELLSAFYLASSAGNLRLAVRSKQEKLHEQYERGELQVAMQPNTRVQLSALTGVTPKSRERHSSVAYYPPVPATVSAPAPTAVVKPRSGSIEVIRGTDRQQINP